MAVSIANGDSFGELPGVPPAVYAFPPLFQSRMAILLGSYAVGLLLSLHSLPFQSRMAILLGSYPYLPEWRQRWNRFNREWRFFWGVYLTTTISGIRS